MKASRKETMSVKNIGKNYNSGDIIPADAKVRKIVGVLTNSYSYTALSDKEIEELSKVNEDRVSSFEEDLYFCYRIRFIGRFSLDNRCYSIMRPCMCTVANMNGEYAITTARFSVMNSIAKLMARLEKDNLSYMELFKVDTEGNVLNLGKFYEKEEILKFITKDKRKGNVDIKKLMKSEVIDEKDVEIELLKKVIAEKERMITQIRIQYRKEKNKHCESIQKYAGDKYFGMNVIDYDRIDEDLRQIISNLNEKGYRTFRSQVSARSIYIYFDDEYEFEIEPPIFNFNSNKKYNRALDKGEQCAYIIVENYKTSIPSFINNPLGRYTILKWEADRWYDEKNRRDDIEQMEKEKQEYLQKLLAWSEKLGRSYFWGMDY